MKRTKISYTWASTRRGPSGTWVTLVWHWRDLLWTTSLSISSPIFWSAREPHQIYCMQIYLISLYQDWSHSCSLVTHYETCKRSNRTQNRRTRDFLFLDQLQSNNRIEWVHFYTKIAIYTRNIWLISGRVVKSPSTPNIVIVMEDPCEGKLYEQSFNRISRWCTLYMFLAGGSDLRNVDQATWNRRKVSQLPLTLVDPPRCGFLHMVSWALSLQSNRLETYLLSSEGQQE